jgi:hypothetical protein
MDEFVVYVFCSLKYRNISFDYSTSRIDRITSQKRLDAFFS